MGPLMSILDEPSIGSRATVTLPSATPSMIPSVSSEQMARTSHVRKASTRTVSATTSMGFWASPLALMIAASVEGVVRGWAATKSAMATQARATAAITSAVGAASGVWRVHADSAVESVIGEVMGQVCGHVVAKTRHCFLT